MSNSLYLSIQSGVTWGSLLFTNAQLQFSENQAWMCCGKMSIHKWRHPKPTGTSEHAGHCTVHTVTDLSRLLEHGSQKWKEERMLLFSPGSSGLHRYVHNTHWGASTESSQAEVFLCKLVPGKAILFLFPHSLLKGIECLSGRDGESHLGISFWISDRRQCLRVTLF